MISESCDTEDYINDAENPAFTSQVEIKINILKQKISQYFHCILLYFGSNAALATIRDFKNIFLPTPYF